MDNHNYEFDKTFECIAGCGKAQSIAANEENNFRRIDQFKNAKKGWIFAHVSYDLKNEIENFSSENEDSISFPDFYFFIPEIVFIL